MRARFLDAPQNIAFISKGWGNTTKKAVKIITGSNTKSYCRYNVKKKSQITPFTTRGSPSTNSGTRTTVWESLKQTQLTWERNEDDTSQVLVVKIWNGLKWQHQSRNFLTLPRMYRTSLCRSGRGGVTYKTPLCEDKWKPQVFITLQHKNSPLCFISNLLETTGSFYHGVLMIRGCASDWRTAVDTDLTHGGQAAIFYDPFLLPHPNKYNICVRYALVLFSI